MCITINIYDVKSLYFTCVYPVDNLCISRVVIHKASICVAKYSVSHFGCSLCKIPSPIP